MVILKAQTKIIQLAIIVILTTGNILVGHNQLRIFVKSIIDIHLVRNLLVMIHTNHIIVQMIVVGNNLTSRTIVSIHYLILKSQAHVKVGFQDPILVIVINHLVHLEVDTLEMKDLVHHLIVTLANVFMILILQEIIRTKETIVKSRVNLKP